MSDIVMVGSLNMDLVVKTRRIPIPGETVQGEDLQLIPGGKGANQAVAAVRLGASVSMVGRVGGDAFGDRMLAELVAQGVRVDDVRRDDRAASGTALIVVDAGGENSIVISPGANGRLMSSDVDQAEATIANAKFVLLQFEIPLVSVAHAIQLAARYDVRTILNPAPANAIPPEIYIGLDILVLNQTELATLTSLPVEEPEMIAAAAGQLLAKGLQAVVVILGSKGAYLATRDESASFPAFPVRAVVSTAAGDAFIGGLAVAWMKMGALKPAVRYANACGALTATQFGAQPSLPDAKQIEAFLAAE